MRTTKARFLWKIRSGQVNQKTFDISYETLDGLAYHLNGAAASICPRANFFKPKVFVCLPELKELDEETFELYMDREEPSDLEVHVRYRGFAWLPFPSTRVHQ